MELILVSTVIARLQLPAAIATTLLSLGGTSVEPSWLIPQAITRPSLRSARLKADAPTPPAAIAIRLVAAGPGPGAAGPHETTVPSALSARLWAAAAIATTLL